MAFAAEALSGDNPEWTDDTAPLDDAGKLKVARVRLGMSQRATAKRQGDTETLRILESPDALSWKYDKEGDVLYISVTDPKPAMTIDVGESVLVRFDEEAGEVVGITIMNVRRRLPEALATRGTA